MLVRERKIEPRERAVQCARRTIVGQGRVTFVVVRAQSDFSALVPDARPESAGTPKYAFEQRGAAACTLVLDILRGRRKPQIAPPVVERVTIDVVDHEAGGWAEYEMVQ